MRLAALLCPCKGRLLWLVLASKRLASSRCQPLGQACCVHNIARHAHLGRTTGWLRSSGVYAQCQEEEEAI
ncbi:hypothetical protein COO60DRAFT_1089776 [Scenedesmus sp. NREL 46B-D3]|nr:hypothetical protein COO60DRAFT_1089776 [Scenedesmus sp. NREL 46B-D3]